MPLVHGNCDARACCRTLVNFRGGARLQAHTHVLAGVQYFGIGNTNV